MSMTIHIVICEFDFFERHHLLSQLFPSERRIRMDIKSRRSWRVSFASYEPRTSVIRVSVSLVIHWYNVHKNSVPTLRSEAIEGHPTGRKHSPESKEITSHKLSNGLSSSAVAHHTLKKMQVVFAHYSSIR